MLRLAALLVTFLLAPTIAMPWNLPQGGRLATHEVKVICRDHKNMENEDQCIVLPLHEMTLEAAAQAVGVPVWHLTFVGAALVDNPGQATPETLYTLEQVTTTLQEGLQTAVTTNPAFNLATDGPYVVLELNVHGEAVAEESGPKSSADIFADVLAKHKSVHNPTKGSSSGKRVSFGDVAR